MDKKKIALIVVVLFLLIGLGSFVFANPDQDNNLEGPGVSEDGGNGDGEVIDGTEPTATPEEENDDSATETDPITTYGNGGNGTGTGAGNNGTTGGVGNTDMSQYDDARRIIEELENRVNSMQNKDDSNDAVDYRTDTDIIDMVNNLPDGTVKDELKDRLDAINKVLDDTTAPVITGINNNDVTKENVTINVTDDNDVTITATLDGEEIEFTTPLTAEGHYVVTVTDKNFNTTTVEFTIDKTPIALDWLYVLNNSGTDYKVIGDGQKLYVELVFSEEFTSTPMIQIGNAEAVEMSCHWTNWQTEKQYFKCDATITIDGSTMGLENGKEVPVKITNVLDAARNETVLTNENITETEKYGHVIYDNQAPEMEVLRLTNVSRKDENGAWLQVAKAGDIVRVIVQFNENLATLPTLKVNGTEVGVMKYDSNMQSYTYDYKVTENDVNGVMQIEISNYADAAGNVGVTLTNADVNHATQNQVVIDTVAPEYAAMGIFNWTNDNDGTDRTYATKDEHIRLYVSFPEMLATNPKVDIYGQDGKVTTLDLSYSEAAKFYFVEFDTTEEFALPEGKINFKVYGYADEAGNVGADLTQDMTTSKEYPEVIYDSVAPVLNFNNGFITDSYTVQVTDDNFDYMTVQYYDGRGLVTLTEPTFELDANGDNIRYNIKAYDKAGNVSAYADIYLDNQKPVISGTGVNGKNEVAVSDNGYYKNATLHIEDGSMKKVVLVHEDGTEEVLAEYKDNYTTEKMVFDRTFDVDGKYTIKAIDRKGNESTITFTIDTVKPVITGIENGAYTNQDVTLNVTDVNPGGTIHLKRNGELVKNYSFGTPIKEEGSYEVYVSDLAGNVSATVTFTIDKTVPTKTSLLFHSSNANNNQLAKPGDWFGVYLTVDEELGQNPVFVVNGVQYEANQFYTAEGVHQYSAVYEIPANTPAQEMTFTISNIVDKAGNTLVDLTNADANEGVNTIVYDNVSPGPRVVGITGFFAEAEDADAHYITTGEGVRILTYYNEKLGTAPIVKIGNKEFQTYYAEQSSDEENGSYAYYADIKITEDLGLSDGEIQFSISGHKDAAGNEGRAYTNADITYGESSPYEMRYDKVILDNVAPEFNVTSGTHGETSMDITITDVNFDYAVVVNQDNGVSENVYKPTFTLQQEATYHIYAYDKAGNVTDLWVAIDNDSPTITIQGNIDDNENRYYNTDVRVNVFDKFLTTVTIDGVTYNRDSFTADSKNENFKFETVVSGQGEHTVTAVDKYGHRNEIIFTIDTANPVFAKVPANNEKVNYSVSPAVSDNYGVASVTLLKDGEVVEGYGLDNMYELSHDGIYELTVTDYAGNSATATFTIDKTAPTFDFSAIPSTFEVGIDSYTYPENGVVVDNFDEPRGFGNVHMLWYKLNDDGTRTAVEPFEWNTDLSNRELGKYVITYRTYDEAGNEAKDERIVTLQDTTPATIIPNRPEVSDFIQGVDTYDTETGVAYDNYDQIGFSAINIEYYLKNADGTETHVDYFAKPSSLEDEIPGVYRIHYWYRDANGNYSQVNRIFNLKNMDDINRVQSLVSTAEAMLNDGTKTIEKIQHSIDVALQEANKLPEFTEKTEFLNQITNLQNILNNRKQYNKVNDYFNQLKSSWYGNESNENVQYYIDVINQQINSFTGYETERQNIINGTTEIQDALNNRKAYQNVVSYLEKAQEANRNGDDESLQNYIDIVKQQINSFTGYETERENILNKVNILQEVKNNRHNYNLLLEYYHNAVDSYNNGEDKQTIQYYIDVTKQQLNRVDNYETEKSNIEKSIQELQEKVNNM
ncbi:MAG: hypothetical protein SOZ06_05410 [Candidatus Faecenecus gallistercoris]|nr:hypothetical protein [Candidatus Faecenecus gallistercoris]